MAKDGQRCIIQSTMMGANYDWVKLEKAEDYKFLAGVVAEKLRNNNFKSSERQTFLKTLIEQLKPSCSFKAYERIQRLLHEVASQKHQEEKEELERLKKQSNVKQNKKASLKIEKGNKQFYAQEDEDSSSDEDD